MFVEEPEHAFRSIDMRLGLLEVGEGRGVQVRDTPASHREISNRRVRSHSKTEIRIQITWITGALSTATRPETTPQPADHYAPLTNESYLLGGFVCSC